MILTLPAIVRALLEPHLPPEAEVRWFTTREEAFAMVVGAEVGWLDMWDKRDTFRAIELGESLRWVATIHAGLDGFPLALMAERGTRITNGTGINAFAVADYAVLGMLALAKDLPAVIRAADRHEWLRDSPGKGEMDGTKALIVGYGAIGRAIGKRIEAFGVEVTSVRRTPQGEPGMLGPNDWKERLGEFDWLILAAPATAETAHLIGAAEFRAMKKSAFLINIARGSLVDQTALIAALEAGEIAGAHLDVTDPEPLPPADPLWNAPHTLITMHLSGRAQTSMFRRAASLFVDNLGRYRAGERLVNEVDFALGY